MARLSSTVPKSLQEFIHHDASKYAQYMALYRIVTAIPKGFRWDFPNRKPRVTRPALIPFIPCVPLSDIDCPELAQMAGEIGWNERDPPVPKISWRILQSFLAYVHCFTILGLESQAMAFSYGKDGVIQYLAIMPQINRVSSVEDANNAPSFFRGA